MLQDRVMARLILMEGREEAWYAFYDRIRRWAWQHLVFRGEMREESGLGTNTARAPENENDDDEGSILDAITSSFFVIVDLACTKKSGLIFTDIDRQIELSVLDKKDLEESTWISIRAASAFGSILLGIGSILSNKSVISCGNNACPTSTPHLLEAHLRVYQYPCATELTAAI